MRKTIFACVLSLVACSAFAAPSSLSKSSGKVLASVTVSGRTETITREDLEAKMAEYKQSGIDVTEDEVLDVLVNDNIFILSAERDKISVSDDEVEDRVRQIKSQMEMSYGSAITDEQFELYISQSMGGGIEEYKESLKESLLVDKYVRTKKSADLDKVILVSDSEIKSFYRKNQSSFVNPEYVRLSHIFRKKGATDVENAKIKAHLAGVLSDIKAGKITFEKAVQTYSEDDASKVKGGDIGNVSASNADVLSDDFIDNVFELEAGELCAEVLESPTGYHIVKAILHADQRFLGIDDYTSPDSSMTVREYIKAGLEQRKSQENYAKVVNEFVDDLKKSARITYSDR